MTKKITRDDFMIATKTVGEPLGKWILLVKDGKSPTMSKRDIKELLRHVKENLKKNEV